MELIFENNGNFHSKLLQEMLKLINLVCVRRCVVDEEKRAKRRAGEYSPIERQQFCYILSKIAFTGRCVPQIGRRFHWLRTHDDTWVVTHRCVSPCGNGGFMHFTIRRKRGRASAGTEGSENETERANGGGLRGTCERKPWNRDERNQRHIKLFARQTWLNIPLPPLAARHPPVPFYWDS